MQGKSNEIFRDFLICFTMLSAFEMRSRCIQDAFKTLVAEIALVHLIQ